MNHDEDYRWARRRTRAIRAFYLHCLIFAAVMVLLLAINVATGARRLVQWPFLGRGVGLAAHAAAIYSSAGWLGSDWEQCKIKELLDRESLR